MTQDYTEQSIEVAGVAVQVLKGGSGEPLLMLHGAGGNPGWLAYHRELAEHFTVFSPSHPGYGQSSRPDWISTMNDMAHFYRQFIEALGLAPVRLLGSSMGGWLAAEIAAMCPPYVRSLVLVDAAGIKPEVGGNRGDPDGLAGCREKTSVLRPDPGPRLRHRGEPPAHP